MSCDGVERPRWRGQVAEFVCVKDERRVLCSYDALHFEGYDDSQISLMRNDKFAKVWARAAGRFWTFIVLESALKNRRPMGECP